MNILAQIAYLAILFPGHANEISIVRTWEQLERQPEIALSTGARIKLGIGSTECPINGGVLLYCLTDAFDPPETWKGWLVGPLEISLKREGVEVQNQPRDGSRPATTPGKRHLFIQSVFADKEGRYSVSLLEPKAKKVLATATIECKRRESYHPWIPFEQEDDLRLANALQGIALPYWSGIYPTATFERDHSRKGNLPTLVESQTPGFLIGDQSGRIKIESEKELIISNPQKRFLARWWVDGKPFIPKQSAPTITSEIENVEKGRKMTISLNLHKETFGIRAAKAKLELQMLYCEDGWYWCVAGGRMVGARGNQVVLISNKIEFRLQD